MLSCLMETSKNWNISGAFSLGANALVFAMPLLPQIQPVFSQATGSTTMPPLAAGLQMAGAGACLIAEGIKTLRGDHASGLRTSKGLISVANVMFGAVGAITNNPFLVGMACLGLVASVIPQIPQNKWPFKSKVIDTPPKAAAVLDFPNIGMQVGSGFAQNPYWFGVAGLCIARMLYQYFAPSVDKLKGNQPTP